MSVPNDVLCKRLDELADAVTRGPASVAREFTMRVPAEPERDADIVLSDAARRIREQESCLFRLNMAALNAIHWLPGGEIKAELRDRYDEATDLLDYWTEPRR